MANHSNGYLFKWLKNLMREDDASEEFDGTTRDTHREDKQNGGTLSDKEIEEILSKGKAEAGQGIFQESTGITPDHNTAIEFINPKNLSENNKNIEKPVTRGGRQEPDEDTFDRLEEEEYRLNNPDKSKVEGK